MTVAAATAVGAPAIVPASALGRAGAVAPSNRVALGVVSGVEAAPYRGVREFLREPHARIVAICDTDPRRAEHLRGLVERAGGNAPGKSSAARCAKCRDIDEIFARTDVDALLFTTLNRDVIGPAIAAARRGKHLFCEQPLAATIADGRALCDAIAAHAGVFHVAATACAEPVYQRLYGMVRGGQLGRLQRIGVQARDGVAATALLDLAQRVNGTETIGPVEIKGLSQNRQGHVGRPENIEAADTFGIGTKSVPAAGFHVEYRYANGVVMEVHSGDLFLPPHDDARDGRLEDRLTTRMLEPSAAAIRFEGIAGWVTGSGAGGSSMASSRSILDRLMARCDDGPGAPALSSPHRDFLDCIRQRRSSATAAEIAHRTATLVNLGGIAMRLARKVQWNPYGEQFIDDPQADALRSRQAGVWMA
jgi:hypothetical protein